MYTIGYFLYDTEYASNLVYYGDSAASWTGDANAVVYEANYVRDEASQHWNLFLTAISSDYDWANMRVSDLTKQSMSVGSIIVYPSWFGVRRASSDDATKGLRKLDGTVCKAGDWIFITATTANAGTSSYKEAPFTLGKMQDVFGLESSPTTDRIYETLNQKPSCLVYKVSYVDIRAFSSLQDWKGVNGTFGSGVAPADTQTGRWLALSSNVDSFKSQGSTTKYKVERQMQAAPTFYGTPMIWDSTKNGGTWTW